MAIEMSTTKALSPAQDMSMHDLCSLIEYILNRLTDSPCSTPVCDLTKSYPDRAKAR